MILNIKGKKGHAYTFHFKYLDPMEVQKHLKKYMKDGEIKECKWEIIGEAELVDAKDVILYG